MDVSEKWGTDVETAVNLALADLKLTRDEVEVTVLEEPSRGFFGIGSKLALVRVEKKKPELKPEPVKVEIKAESTVKKYEEKPKKSEVKKIQKNDKKGEKKENTKDN